SGRRAGVPRPRRAKRYRSSDVPGAPPPTRNADRTTGREERDMETKGTPRLKTGLAEMLKGGVIMDVTTADQAKIAEEAGAVAVMALERVPADIRAAGGVARMASPRGVREIQEAVTIPGLSKARIRPFALPPRPP